jgi:hypothetical protein
LGRYVYHGGRRGAEADRDIVAPRRCARAARPRSRRHRRLADVSYGRGGAGCEGERGGDDAGGGGGVVFEVGWEAR